ncbi:MAG: radical SAM/SPASM domain-containing protein [Stackebrandtia sp.]
MNRQHNTVESAWLEIMGKCQLECVHCYAESGPNAAHSTLTLLEWKGVADQLNDLGCGLVQLIGGEPTLHPDFAELTSYILTSGMRVEVATNLVHVTAPRWELYQVGGMSLSVSYYGATATEHASVTGTRGSHARTRANIAEAVRRGVPIRVGVIAVNDSQDVEAAIADLRSLGVENVGVDDVRGVGRGAVHAGDEGMANLCGACGRGQLAVGPTGRVWPCVIGRGYPVGDVRSSLLSEILVSPQFRETVAAIGAATGVDCGCGPDAHAAEACGPHGCVPRIEAADHAHRSPCAPKPCNPDYGCRPQQPCKPNRAFSAETVTAAS